ncbi:hypothetical protein A2U01_0049973, partial [Trifolium medium]|nr:hypothetical protein [Trifolium medium]
QHNTAIMPIPTAPPTYYLSLLSLSPSSPSPSPLAPMFLSSPRKISKMMSLPIPIPLPSRTSLATLIPTSPKRILTLGHGAKSSNPPPQTPNPIRSFSTTPPSPS